MALISPGVELNVINDSFFIPAGASTIPLLFIATEDEKLQSDGVTSALGTFEYDVIQTVTSRKQLLELYGIPKFLVDGSSNQLHGDARNEYGLFAAYNYLGVASRLYVIRTNVNLNDDITAVRALWDKKAIVASALLNNLAQSTINDFNTANGYITGDASSGYQDVDYTNPLVGTDLLGLAANTYDFNIVIDGGAPTNISVVIAGGEDVDALIVLINAQLTGAVAAINTGNIRITSDTTGVSSTIAITAGTTLDLFVDFTGNAFVSYDTAVPGAPLFKVTVTAAEIKTLAVEAATDMFNSFSFISSESTFFTDITSNPINVYANGYTVASTGTYIGFDGDVEAWVTGLAGSLVNDEFTPLEAETLFLTSAGDFDFTKEFKNNISLGANDAARRVTISTALQSSVNNNQEIRAENFEFNLAACPGYHEVTDELVALSTDIKEEAFVLSDTPFDMTSAETATWAETVSRQSSTNVAYYYPHGLASNVDGTDVFVPATSTALRTIAYSDDQSELWFAPAGTRRGVVTGLSDVGYVSGTLGSATTFTPLHLNIGQRDDLYKYFTNVNPITFFPGRGILVWGQKTSAATASALDRINVVRLVMYIRRQLRKNTMSYVFEPNDQITRENLNAMISGFLGDLVVRRGLYDFAVLVDESNNTPTVIDENKIIVDIAIKPVKAAEFITINLKIVNTGDDI